MLYRLDDGVTLARRVRSVHRWTSHLTVITSVAAAALVAAEAIAARTPRRPKARVVLGVPLVLTLVVASLSGFILPWDQLALKAVTVGTNMKGYGPIFGDQVRFALVRGAEVDVSTLRMWTVVHVVTAALAVPLLLVLGRRPRRAQQPAPPPPAGPPATPSS